MNNNKYLLLFASLGALALLVAAAVQENFYKQWRAIQLQAKSETGPVEPRLRQIVIPALQTIDRCVSCHAGMDPSETGLTGPGALAPHKPLPHEPSEFGCTTCHAGQGRATDMADAHGTAKHWPAPLIPARFAYAGCGSCHSHLRVPNEAELARGLRLFAQHDCYACHRLDGRGGTLRVGGVGGMEGPDLSRAGAAGYDPGWHEAHAARAQAEPGLWSSTFAPVNGADRADLAALLDSRVGAPELIAAKALFHSLGCRGCHKVNGVGGSDGPDLTRAGERDPGQTDFSRVQGEHTLANWFIEHFQDPARIVPGSAMPALGLDSGQIDLLTLYMFSLRHSNFPEAFWPRDRIRAERFNEREFATDGATLFGTFCAACHGAAGGGMRYPGLPLFPSIANPDFLAAASDAFITDTILRGRPGRRMPAWGGAEGGLTAEEVANIVGYLRQVGGQQRPAPDLRPPRWAAGDPADGGRLFDSQCASCHGPEGQGGEAVALNNAVLLATATDTYLVQTVSRGRRGTVMNGFASPSTVHQTLSTADIESIVSFIRTWEKKL